jgi:hypothetical protein
LVTVLRALLGLAFTALVLAQVTVLPWLVGEAGDEWPQLAPLRMPLLAVAVAELLCVQVVIWCTWELLTLVEEDRIFSESAFGWVHAILGAVVAAWLLLFGTLLAVDDLWRLPGLAVGLLLMLVAEAVLGLLMVVMRALLRQATTLRADLEAVI